MLVSVCAGALLWLHCAQRACVRVSSLCWVSFLPYVCRAVLLAFSRDASVMQQAAVLPHPVLSAAGASQSQQPTLAYPPSGVLPFQGLCAYLAPLCFLYGSPAAVYPVWHAMYCQYWCRLHSLSASPAPAAGLAVLCRTFLDLLQVCGALAGRLVCS